MISTTAVDTITKATDLFAALENHLAENCPHCIKLLQDWKNKNGPARGTSSSQDPAGTDEVTGDGGGYLTMNITSINKAFFSNSADYQHSLKLIWSKFHEEDVTFRAENKAKLR